MKFFGKTHITILFIIGFLFAIYIEIILINSYLEAKKYGGINEFYKDINNHNLESILDPRPISDSLYLNALLEGLAEIELKGWEKLHAITGSLPKKIITIGLAFSFQKVKKIIINKRIKIFITIHTSTIKLFLQFFVKQHHCLSKMMRVFFVKKIFFDL